VRQLSNVIERAVVLGEGELIPAEDLAEEVVESAVGLGVAEVGSFQVLIETEKKRLILDAVQRAGGDLRQAAEALGIHLNSLHRLIRNLGLRAELPD
jgi:DNA-binding NtrC family response regulator